MGTSVSRNELVQYLDQLLNNADAGSDASNNGLQVQGSDRIEKACFSVDACAQFFEESAACGADFLFVHHGLSWGDSLKYLTGLNANRVRMLFKNDMSLYASHLPLDMHPEVGHNAVIASWLELRELRPFFEYGGTPIGWAGRLPSPISLSDLAQLIDNELNTESQVVNGGSDVVETLGIVSGGGADAVSDCYEQGLDCLLTGEIVHQHYHSILESGINVITAGHYRTEIPGVEVVMERVMDEFGIDCEFIDIPTGY